jgi:hypothetical protein
MELDWPEAILYFIDYIIHGLQHGFDTEDAVR